MEIHAIFCIIHDIDFNFVAFRPRKCESILSMRIFFNISRCLSPYIMHLILKHFQIWIEEITIIVICATNILYIDLNSNNFSSMSPSDVFLFGMLVQIMSDFLIPVRVSFHQVCFIVFINVFFIL